MYCPDCSLPNEWTIAVLVWVVLLPITGCAVLVVINPAGPVHTVFTITETSTDGLNSTTQVRVTIDPIGRIGLALLLVILTDKGSGTVQVLNGVQLQDLLSIKAYF